jgi:hypothetical protein
VFELSASALVLNLSGEVTFSAIVQIFLSGLGFLFKFSLLCADFFGEALIIVVDCCNGGGALLW